ncbi:MAG TPA: MauE/DoxX family redox-associated membrane protein [Flavitalea sp.]|nr:MauE/DoxX family redox-associated membrane protein [Flavitalea sp.]
MKKISLYIMVCLYIAAGVNHFLNPETYERIMPTWLGWKLPLVYFSGVCEIVFGLLLIPGVTRRIAAWCLIALLIAVFPANIQMMINYYQQHDPNLWISIIRLPLQIVLIWWAWVFTRPLEKRFIQSDNTK